MTARIRPFVAADAEAVAAMIHALNAAEGYDPRLGPDAAALPAAYLGAQATGRCLVAEMEGVIVGYATLHVTYETTFASRGVYVADLYVVPPARLRGIGRALIGAAARLAAAEGGGHLWWTALPHNEAGQAFYRRLGAEPEPVIAFALARESFAQLAQIDGPAPSRPMIRHAQAADAPAVATLINAINSLDGPLLHAMTPEIVQRDLLGDRPKALLRVAESDGRVIGFATAGFIYDAERAADALMLLDLYVVPEARRRGAARALMAALAAEARRHGAGCLWWGVDAGDDEATLFYRAIGATSEGQFSGELLEGAALDALAAEHTP